MNLGEAVTEGQKRVNKRQRRGGGERGLINYSVG